MLPVDPSLLFAAGVILDLIHDNLERKLSKEEGAGFWVEWLAWAILLAVYWAIPIIYRHTANSTSDVGSEAAVLSEKRLRCKIEAWVAYALSFCLVATGSLWQSEHGQHKWALVS